jgi:hypothetical protein
VEMRGNVGVGVGVGAGRQGRDIMERTAENQFT